jgi:hypothetical protein
MLCGTIRDNRTPEQAMNGSQQNSHGAFAIAILIAGLVSPFSGRVVQAADPKNPVTVIATHHGGIQPQVLADAAGVLHLIY